MIIRDGTNNIVPDDTVAICSNRQKYHAGVPQQVVGLARQGMFPEEWCAELGVSIRTIYSWANERPEFEEAVEHAWHLLHAYWARLLRDNISNPAFRQTAAMQVMAKRFPATWGKEPRNTLEHFVSRNEPSDKVKEGRCEHCEKIKNMSDEEIKEKIAVLQRRRMMDH